VAHHGFRPDDTPQVMETGQRRPAHACALGKVLLAYEPSAAALLRLQPLAEYTPRTVTSARALARELAQVRRDGWALAAEELSMGTAGLAAPVRDRGGLTVAAIGVTGPVEQVCDFARAPRGALVHLVQDAARAVSRELATSG
jgi:DNA-binding IclR family transcriptional regulator